MFQLVQSMKIDEERKMTLTKYGKEKEEKVVVKSDHNVLMLDIVLKWCLKVPTERKELFNLKNKVSRESFQIETERTTKLSKSFHKKDIKVGGKL